MEFSLNMTCTNMTDVCEIIPPEVAEVGISRGPIPPHDAWATNNLFAPEMAKNSPPETGGLSTDLWQGDEKPDSCHSEPKRRIS